MSFRRNPVLANEGLRPTRYARPTLTTGLFAAIAFVVTGCGSMAAMKADPFEQQAGVLDQTRFVSPPPIIVPAESWHGTDARESNSPDTANAQHGVTTSGGLRTTQVKSLVAHDLKGIDGKEGSILLVEYPPGGSDAVHRHNAHVFVYMLEGSAVMQVRGGPEVTLHPGDTFVETPDDVHVVARNASATKRARFIAFFVKDKDAPPVVSVH